MNPMLIFLIWYASGASAVAYLIYQQGILTIQDLVIGSIFATLGPIMWTWIGFVWAYENIHVKIDKVLWTKK